jgi:signal transduction histidine kinase/CheY-like chemotaxis protein
VRELKRALEDVTDSRANLQREISERIQAEVALRHSEEQLRQSQKMEAVGRLAGGIAHDFNNLLTAITGYGDLLLRRLGEGSPQRREAQAISKAAQRATELTAQLLAFSRQQVLQPRVLDLREIVSEIGMMLERVIGEHIELVTEVAPEIGAVRADPGQVHQVLLNLAVNAHDAMPEGGKLTIAACNVTVTSGHATSTAGVPPGAYVMLVVKDTGCGMDEATRARMFEPFFTTKVPGKGTGLGLSTVYGIVKQSGGHITVDSAPGRGSTFHVYFPEVVGVVVEPLRRSEEEPLESTSGTETILLVEDDDSVRDLAREVLELSGYTVCQARNGLEALSVLEAGAEPIDLMVTDLVMPQLGGRDLVQRVAPAHPELRVLYLSGYADSDAQQKGLLDAGSFFLQKPFTPDALSRKVREALDAPLA